MREIKFRVWDDKDKKWLLGYEFQNLGGFSMFGEVMVFGEYTRMLNSYKLDDWDRIKLMQFTGLYDKNGKEIYEGDIVTYQQAERFGESVSDYRTIVKYEEYGFTPMKYHSECEDGFYSCLISDIEVIGNIYENPEQLV